MTDTLPNGLRALIVVTSVGRFPDGERPTGFYLDEMAIPYYRLRDAGVDVRFASIRAGHAPIDPASIGDEGARKPAVQRFLDDASAGDALASAPAIDAVDPDDWDLLFLPGGHGTMWDFAESSALARTVARLDARGAVIGAVCHGPAGLVNATRADGRPVVEGRRVNAFTDEEERAVGLDATVPYLLESTLRAKGTRFESGERFGAYAVRDGNLVTGQNPASAPAVADLLIEALEQRVAGRRTPNVAPTRVTDAVS